MLCPTYYRSLLTQAQQVVYRLIVASALRLESPVMLPPGPISPEDIRAAMDAAHFDHPEIFWVDWWHYQLSSEPILCRIIVRLSFLLEKQTVNACTCALQSKTEDVLRHLPREAGAARRYRILASAVIDSVQYKDTGSAFWDHTVVGPVIAHTAVCEGIAKLYLLYCQRANLPCILVSGLVDGKRHAWNQVEMDGQAFYVDVTALLEAKSLACLAFMFKDARYMRSHGYTLE